MFARAVPVLHNMPGSSHPTLRAHTVRPYTWYLLRCIPTIYTLPKSIIKTL